MRHRLPIGAFVCFVFITAPFVRAASDVGDVQFPNSGSAAAQPPFLRGLALLHSFEYEDAAKEFRKAQELDPAFAMAFWGEAMTYNHPIWMEQDRDAAVAVLKRLGPTPELRLAKASTQREKDFLQAVEILYGEGSKDQRDFAYCDAMGRMHQRSPQDPEAAAFYALSILGTAHHGRDFAIYMRAAGVLEELFRDYPEHPGVAHYLIHCYDDPIHAPLGLRPARVYSKIAPAAPHAQHMTSHIFLALGMWDDVVSANENAVRVVNAHRKERGQPPRSCGHYNFWLLYGYLQQGRPRQAMNLLTECRASAQTETGETHPGMVMVDPDRSQIGSLVVMWARYILDTDGWSQETAEWTFPSTADLNPQATIHWIAGMRAVHNGKLDRARQELEELKKVLSKMTASADENKDAYDSFVNRADVLKTQLEGMILLASGKANDGISLLQQAAAKEESLPMDFGPPLIDKPSRELLGESLLRLHRATEAVPAFEAALQRAPERTASLLGLYRAASSAGDKQTASEVLEKLRQIWKNAEQVPEDLKIKTW